MIVAVSITTLTLPLLIASAAGMGSLTATSFVRGQRNIRRIEQEFALYDRAFEIYSRFPGAADAGARLMVSDELTMIAALHACGSLDDRQYDEAKAQILSRLDVSEADSQVGSATE